MTRLNLVLLVALLVSSVYLVRVSYESRRLFAALDKAQGEERTLDHDAERLKTELQISAISSNTFNRVMPPPRCVPRHASPPNASAGCRALRRRPA